MSIGCYDKGANKGADPTGRHQDTVTVRAASEHVTRERGHDYHIRPTENADRQKQQQNHAHARMLERIDDSVPGMFRRRNDVDVPSKTGSRIISNPTMTATKLRALNKKHAQTSTAPIISP